MQKDAGDGEYWNELARFRVWRRAKGWYGKRGTCRVGGPSV